MRINKSEVVQFLADRTEISTSAAERIVREFIELIYETLRAGDEVNLSGFGKFSVQHRKARLGVDPRNPSVRMQNLATKNPKFKAGEKFKAIINS